MKSRIILFSIAVCATVLFAYSLSLGESNDGAKALFFGETTKETTVIKQTQSGSAGFSGTEVQTETFGTENLPPSEKKIIAKGISSKKSTKLATGLAYWIEVIQPNGKSIRATAESRIFKSGERIRFAFKTNKTGYLYLLSLGSSGKGTVLFPDPRINDGKNLVAANIDYKIPFGTKSFVMDTTPGEEKVLVFFSESEIGDIRDYFIGNTSNKQIEAQDTQRLYAYAQSNGSKDILFEEDVLEAKMQPASYIVNKSIDPKSVIFKEITIRHK